MFQEGRTNTARMLGYRLVEGVLTVIPEEAVVVRLIFEAYLSGMGKMRIAKSLMHLAIPTRNADRWNFNTITKILKNEKYTGNMILQKTFSLDHISKKARINNGELPKYHVKNSHEAIIDDETFALVQAETQKRAERYRPAISKTTSYPFTGKVRCGICGKTYQRKMNNAGSKYQKPVWICPTFNFYGKSACASQQIPENILEHAVLEVLGLHSVCKDIFATNISIIHVESPGLLRFVCKDGFEKLIEWSNPSRSKSWTEDMRQAARERRLKISEERKTNE